jgi:cellulose synthase/poly-beta-1,6-N-acetylglucosamine synthase-like glycosyltransferase
MTHLADMLQGAFVVFYLVVLVLLCVYGLHRYLLVALYFRHRHNAPARAPEPAERPFVTVQLPVFNERYVVWRLLNAVRLLDYPRDRLEVQVLDDSTDDTRDIACSAVEEMRREGIDVRYLHRASRDDYKAGALRYGLEHAAGEYIAIFDADFVPDPQFLRRVLPHFSDERIGMVQTRWGYLNRNYSLLTRLQAIYLDAHFIIEHLTRNRSGCFFNFNGTGGVWRKQCLLDAGNWQADTLTEDLDISYRAQLQGWRFVFAADTVVPSELPVEVTGFKTQQFRWAKGSIQTAMKLLGPVLRSSHPFKVKLEAFFHLTNNVSYLLMIFLSLSMYPAMIIRFNIGWRETILLDVPLLLAATLSVSVFYLTSQQALFGGRWWRQLPYLPFLMGLGIGLSLNNGRAVLSALFGVDSEFKRTPKHGIEGRRGAWLDKRYVGRIDFVILGELFMVMYFGFSIYFALLNEIYVAIPFLLLFAFGFGYVSLLSLWQAGSRVVAQSVRAPLCDAAPGYPPHMHG